MTLTLKSWRWEVALQGRPSKNPLESARRLRDDARREAAGRGLVGRDPPSWWGNTQTKQWRGAYLRARECSFLWQAARTWAWFALEESRRMRREQRRPARKHRNINPVLRTYA